MASALGSHPEWAGEWQMPSGIEQVEIDPATGNLAAPESASRRVELFVSGTAPTESSNAPVEDPSLGGEADGPVVEDEDAAPPPAPGAIEVPVMPEATPRTRGTPGLEGRGVTQPDGSSRLTGTITLDIDPTTGYIAADTCPIIRSRTFVIGAEPRRRCGPQYHNGQQPITPSETRPRRISP
jgi:hypothetical protein